MHIATPKFPLHVPALQGTQDEIEACPAKGFAVPIGHCVQLLAPASEKVPVGQIPHAVIEAIPVLGFQVPPTQGVQVPAP